MDPPEKRGRGRPRKYPPPDPNAPKRGRGRPPKDASSSPAPKRVQDSAQLSGGAPQSPGPGGAAGADLTPSKSGPGRPKKDPNAPPSAKKTPTPQVRQPHLECFLHRVASTLMRECDVSRQLVLHSKAVLQRTLPHWGKLLWGMAEARRLCRVSTSPYAIPARA
eukprot:3260760-Rhodomonas_salina.1